MSNTAGRLTFASSHSAFFSVVGLYAGYVAAQGSQPNRCKCRHLHVVVERPIEERSVSRLTIGAEIGHQHHHPRRP